MKTNMGNIDKFVRIAVAIAIAACYATHVITGALGIGLLILSVIFVITSFVGFCPLYLPFGFSTKKKKNANSV